MKLDHDRDRWCKATGHGRPAARCTTRPAVTCKEHMHGRFASFSFIVLLVRVLWVPRAAAGAAGGRWPSLPVPHRAARRGTKQHKALLGGAKGGGGPSRERRLQRSESLQSIVYPSLGTAIHRL
jgi:hypothetical protein